MTLRLWLTLTLALAAAGPAEATTRALVIGIDAYSGTPPPLEGAVNDAEDMVGSLRKLGIATVTLENAAASRASVVAAYDRLLAESRAGDDIYFHFSGHGITLPDDNGDEADGRDESFLLASFDETRHPDEQLIDDDLDQLFASAGARGVNVIFVADACHSGSPARAVGADALPTRMYRPKTDPTRPPPVEAGTQSVADRRNVIAVGATSDDRTIPELMIDDKPRGALSYAVARALDGRADLDGDGRITASEFEVYVRQIVRNVAAAKQTPQFDVPEPTRLIAAVKAPPTDIQSTALPQLPIEVRLSAGRDKVLTALADVAGIKLVDTSTRAALILDPESGDVANAVRDRIAKAADPARDFPTIVKTAQLMEGINRLSLDHPLTISFSPSDDVQPAGTSMTFRVSGMAGGYLTVFDVTGSGTVQTLWPLGPDDADPWDPSQPFELSAVVSPPFGADNLVVVATADEPEALRALLGEEDRSPSPEALFAALNRTARQMPTEIGVQAFFSREN